MHHTTIHVAPSGRQVDGHIWVNHNSDWSGPAILGWSKEGASGNVEVPGWVAAVLVAGSPALDVLRECHEVIGELLAVVDATGKGGR